MSSCCGSVSPDACSGGGPCCPPPGAATRCLTRRGPRRYRGRWQHFLLGLFLLLHGLATATPVAADEPAPSPRAALNEPLPIQDNELILGISGGIFFAREQSSPTSRDVRLRIGGEHEIFVGLLNRALSWLDVELVGGLNVSWLGEEGFTQDTPRGIKQAGAVVGFHIRGTAHLVPWPGAGPTLSTGVVVSVMSAPAEGWVTRFIVEAGMGWDLFRTDEYHAGLDVMYGWPAFDGLQRVDGSPLLDELHRVLLRLTWGF